MRDAGAVDFVAKGRLDPDLVEIVVRCRASPPAPQARPPTEPLNNARHSAPCGVAKLDSTLQIDLILRCEHSFGTPQGAASPMFRALSLRHLQRLSQLR